MNPRSRFRGRLLTGALVPALMAAGACDGAASGDPAPGPRTPRKTAAAGVPCLGYNGLNRLNPPSEVRAGRFRMPLNPSARVTAGTGDPADIDWGLDPYNDRSWMMWFHSLEWLGGLIQKYERSGDRAALRLATGIVRDWLADNSGAEGLGERRRDAIHESHKFRLITLTCLRAHHAAGWLDEAITGHARRLADPQNWAGPWNHGTDESMTLMAAGCVLGRPGLADVGYRRLVGAVLDPPDGVRPVIDAQGANNEQSTHYSVYNRSLWHRVMKAMRGCGRPVPAELTRRYALMDEFIAFQAMPDGDMLQIGESYARTVEEVARPGDGAIRYVATRGREGTRPARARVYRAGYVMGRSGWGEGDRAYTREMAYTARFGPGRYAHGQDDHMALTFFAQGRDVLVPSGHIGYNEPDWRSWLRSPEAHNTLVVQNARFDPGAATALTHHRFRAGADTFGFSDTAYAGTTRTRSVLAATGPDALVVLDRARSGTPRTVEQLWHLPPEYRASAGGWNASAAAGDVRVHFVRAELPGGLPARVVRGDTAQGKGWVVPEARSPKPAPVVRMGARGTDVRILTLIAPVRAGDRGGRPELSVSTGPGGRLRAETEIGGQRLAFEITPRGTLRRIP